MDAAEIDRRGNALLDLTTRCEALLRRHGVDFWADQVGRARAELERGDLHGAWRVQNMMGRSGLHDLMITAGNGHKITPGEEGQVNRALERLIADMATHAEPLSRV